MDTAIGEKKSRSADMALQRKLRTTLRIDGYKRPFDIRYIRHGWGSKSLDGAVVYGPPEINGIPALALYVVEDAEWVCVYERQFC